MRVSLLLLGLSSGLAIGVFSAMAGTCRAGKIVSVLEGGWDSNDIMIKLDYSSAYSSHPGTEKSGRIVYKSVLDERSPAVDQSGVAVLVITAS